MMKIKAIAFIVCLILIINISLTTVSSNDIQNEFKHLNKLHALEDLGLIGVSDWNPDLNSIIRREYGISKLISVIGKWNEIYEIERDEAEEILSKYEDNTEVSPYVGTIITAYAVKEGLVIGTSKTTLSPRMQMNGKMFATIILRHLGYEVTVEDYEQACMILSTKNGISIEDAIRLNDKELIL